MRQPTIVATQFKFEEREWLHIKVKTHLKAGYLLLVHAFLQFFVHDGRGWIEPHLGQVVHDQQVEIVEHELLPDFGWSLLLLLILRLVGRATAIVVVAVLMHQSIFIFSLLILY